MESQRKWAFSYKIEPPPRERVSNGYNSFTTVDGMTALLPFEKHPVGLHSVFLTANGADIKCKAEASLVKDCPIKNG